MIVTSLASATRPLWRLLEYYKIDPAFVFRAAGLDPEVMNWPRGRYNTERWLAAWRMAAELIDDPCFGLKGAETWSPTDLHALGYAFLASSTLRTALERLSRYMKVVSDAVGYDLGTEDGNISVSLSTEADVYRPLFPPLEDAAWATITSLCRTAFGEELNPVELRLLHSAPKCVGDYYAFFRCRVTFDSDVSAMLFARADVDHPLPASNKELAQANDKILSGFLAELHKDDLLTKVKAAIADALPSGTPGDCEIARSLYMSARTLNRKLSAFGTNYSQVLDAVRRELAEKYLADPAFTLSEVSFLLGFSEQSAFSRAFRRWTGQAPNIVRQTASA